MTVNVIVDNLLRATVEYRFQKNNRVPCLMMGVAMLCVNISVVIVYLVAAYIFVVIIVSLLLLPHLFQLLCGSMNNCITNFIIDLATLS